MDGTFFVKTHIEQCNPLLQKAWYLLKFAVQTQDEKQQKIYLEYFWTSIDEYYRQIAQFDGFQCGVGCSHCCFDNPHGISTVEIQRLIPRLTDKQKELVVSYFEEWNLLVQENPLLRQQAWKKKCLPCPLLEDGSCSVYDVRPMACRSFFSVHHPDWCHPLHPKYQQQPQIGHDDIHSLLEMLSTQNGWPRSQDLISGLYHQIQETHL